MFFSWQHLCSMNKKAGAPSYHHTINYYIDSCEWDVYVFTTDASNKDLRIYEEGKVHLFSDNKIIENISGKRKINHLSLPVKHNNYTKWAVAEASKIIEKTQGDIVLYGYEVWGVKAAYLLSVKYKLPLITRFQGTILSYEEHNMRNRIIHYPHYEALETKADLIIMTDDSTMGDKTLKELGNFSKTLFLRNGLDLYEHYKEIHEEFNVSETKRALHIPENMHILLMASRLTSWKRVDRGIRAVKKVLEGRKDVRLLIAGDGDSRQSLESLVNKLDIKDHVSFLGSVPQKDLYKYMLCADVFLSLYDLGNLGNPTFEAMLMKKAIIALNGGDTSTVIHNEENGVLLEYDEEARIPEMINKIINDEGFKSRIEAGAFEFAETNFYSWKTRMKIEEDAIINIL